MKIKKEELKYLINANEISLDYFLRHIFFNEENDFVAITVAVENVEKSRGYLEDFEILSIVKTQYLTYKKIFDFLALEFLEGRISSIRINDEYITIYIRKKG